MFKGNNTEANYRVILYCNERDEWNSAKMCDYKYVWANR